MDNQDTSSSGLWRYGNQFREASILILVAHNYSGFMPFYFLVGQSIELFLKAFLVKSGISLGVLKAKPYGHDLNALLDTAKQKDLYNWAKLESTEVAVIDLLNLEYLARRFQYMENGTKYLPEPQLIISAVDKLSTGVKYFCDGRI